MILKKRQSLNTRVTLSPKLRSNLLRNTMLITLVSAFFAACVTEDVVLDPNDIFVTLATDKILVPEEGGSAQITANLSAISSNDITVSLVFSGSATIGVDYNMASSILIPKGQLSATTTLNVVQDTLEEGTESIIVTIATADGATLGEPKSVLIEIEDDDVAPVFRLILNEILYDPSNIGLDGDANGDGVYAQNEDEFVELVNLSSQSFDISGFTFYDTKNLLENIPNHTVPAGTILPPGKAFVLFGGGKPKGTFGGAIVQTSTFGDLNLSNAGDILTVKNAEGEVLLTFDIEPLSNNPNESYTRNPDLSGEFVPHSKVNSLLFSPGTKSDGAPF